MTPTRRAEWERREAAGEVRLTEGQYKCARCREMHVVKRPMHCSHTERNTTMEDLVLNAAQWSRLRGCPHGNADKSE